MGQIDVGWWKRSLHRSELSVVGVENEVIELVHSICCEYCVWNLPMTLPTPVISDSISIGLQVIHLRSPGDPTRQHAGMSSDLQQDRPVSHLMGSKLLEGFATFHAG